MDSSNKTWTVVRFTDDDTVEAVPSIWLNNNQCYWPVQYMEHKINSAIKHFEEPDKSSWALYSVSVFRKATYDNYLIARQKAKKATFTSDLESDNGKRKIVKPIVSSSDEEGESVTSILPKPPRPTPGNSSYLNTFQKNTNITKISSEDNERKIAYVNPNINENNIPEQIEPEEILMTNPPYKRLMRNDCDSPSSSRCGTPIGQNICSCCPAHKGSFDLLKQTLRKQNIIQAMMSQVLDELSVIRGRDLNRENENNDQLSIFLQFSFPIDEENTLIAFDNYLSDANNFTLSTKEVSKIGGSTPYDFVKRTALKLITDRLASEYSFLGAKKKKIFKNLKLSNLLIESALKNECTKNSTSKEMEEAIKNWLRRAKERAENKLKKNTN